MRCVCPVGGTGGSPIVLRGGAGRGKRTARRISYRKGGGALFVGADQEVDHGKGVRKGEKKGNNSVC